MKKLIIIITSLLPIMAFSQVSVGISVGAFAPTNKYENAPSPNSNSKIGANVSCYIYGGFSASIGAEYNSFVFSQSVNVTNNYGTTKTKADIYHISDYISVPISIKYNVFRKSKMSPFAMITAGRMFKISDSEQSFMKAKDSFSYIGIGIGGRLKVTEKISFTLQINKQQMMSSIYNYASKDLKYNGIGAIISINYNLVKRKE